MQPTSGQKQVQKMDEWAETWVKSEHASQVIINKSPHLIGSSKASHSGWDVPNVWVRQLRYARVLTGSKKKKKKIITEKIFSWKPQNVSLKLDYSGGIWIFWLPWSKYLIMGDHNRPTPPEHIISPQESRICRLISEDTLLIVAPIRKKRQ